MAIMEQAAPVGGSKGGWSLRAILLRMVGGQRVEADLPERLADDVGLTVAEVERLRFHWPSMVHRHPRL